MKQILNVEINKDKSYQIEISDNSFDKLNRDINAATEGQKRLIVIYIILLLIFQMKKFSF